MIIVTKMHTLQEVADQKEDDMKINWYEEKPQKNIYMPSLAIEQQQTSLGVESS